MGSIFLRNKMVFWGTVLFLLFVLIVLTKIAFIPTNNLPKQTIIPTPTVKAVGFCAQFPTDKGEISCEQAKGIALKKHPGQLITIDKTIRHYEAGKPPVTQTKEAKVWLVDIRPDDQSIFPPAPKPQPNVKFLTTDTIGIAVDRSTGEILFYEPVFKK